MESDRTILARHILVRTGMVLIGIVPVSWCALERDARAQTVQLPSYGFFGTSTTVLVPDGGSALLGGVGSRLSGREENGFGGFGPPVTNASIASSRMTGVVNVSALIHDFAAMDEALLSSPLSGAETAKSAEQPRLAEIKRVLGDSTIPESVAEIRRQQALEAQAKGEQLRAMYDHALQLEKQGKRAVARVYYSQLVQRAEGELRETARQRLAAIQKAEGQVNRSQSAGTSRQSAAR